MDKKNYYELLKALLTRQDEGGAWIQNIIAQYKGDKIPVNAKADLAAEIIRRLRIQNKKLLERVRILREQLKQEKGERMQLVHKINYLGKLNASLSDALGSCRECWGEDAHCTVCAGKGYPGWRKVNKRLFNVYILPSLEKMLVRRKQ
jgi:hypothetical protein